MPALVYAVLARSHGVMYQVACCLRGTDSLSLSPSSSASLLIFLINCSNLQVYNELVQVRRIFTYLIACSTDQSYQLTCLSGIVPKHRTAICSLQVARSPFPTHPNLPTREIAEDPPQPLILAPLLLLDRSEELLLNREPHPRQELLLNTHGETTGTFSASIGKVRLCGSM